MLQSHVGGTERRRGNFESRMNKIKTGSGEFPEAGTTDALNSAWSVSPADRIGTDRTYRCPGVWSI